MFEEAIRALLQLEGDGFKATAERNPAARETEIIVQYRPNRAQYIRTSVSENAMEDMRSHADYLVGVIGEGAAKLRGAAIVDVLRSGRPVRFERSLSADQSSGLVSGFLGALEACEGVEEETAEILGRRLVHIVTKHCDQGLCERLALELMAHVERIGR